MTNSIHFPTAAATLLAIFFGSFLTKNIEGFSTPSFPSTRTSTAKTLSASRHLVEIEDSNFRELFSGNEHVLVDCCAQWCGPCKLIEPTLEEAAKKWKDTLVVGKYDVESENDQVKVELLLQGVMPQALPALILMHKNKVLTTWKGVIRPEELNALLEKHIEKGYGATETRELAMTSSGPARKKSGLISFATAEDDYMLKP